MNLMVSIKNISKLILLFLLIILLIFLPFDITQYGTFCIRGTNLNNIFVVGAYGEVLHFNGFSWKSFLSELGTIQGSYGSVDIKNNVIAITGYDGRKAKITIARAQK